MAYSSSLDDFKPRDPKKGDSVLMAFLDADGQVKYVTAANPLPSTPGVGATEATQLSVLAAVDTLEALLAPLVLAGQGTKSVAAAATPEAISGSSVPCRAVMLTNASASTIAYGTSTSVSVTGLVGAQIPAGKSHLVSVSNLNLLFVDVTTDGDDVSFTYYT